MLVAFLTLVGISFAAATLLPFSSEVALFSALQMGMPTGLAFLAASLGNSAGATFNYVLGTLAADRVEQKLKASKSGQRALDLVHRWGPWSLLLSWTPVLGDPVCLAAGLFRAPLWAFVVLGIGTRLLRYVFVLWVA